MLPPVKLTPEEGEKLVNERKRKRKLKKMQERDERSGELSMRTRRKNESKVRRIRG